MAEARRKKFARRDRLAEKSCRMEQRQQHKGSGWAGTDSRRSLTISTSPVERKASRGTSKADAAKVCEGVIAAADRFGIQLDGPGLQSSVRVGEFVFSAAGVLRDAAAA
ncbi:unnamed protein product [Phytophthora lilii]|uniref:Unnamed protein product n=1 Tax=Phytophthora lilii TaxID=2077276 RepID=A0A9W6X0A1_9STRA|nr:unnamed protein product [Phytophthora lilii]